MASINSPECHLYPVPACPIGKAAPSGVDLSISPYSAEYPFVIFGVIFRALTGLAAHQVLHQRVDYSVCLILAFSLNLQNQVT